MTIRRMILQAGVLLLSFTVPSWAQYYVGGGNALDANNRLGSGGMNTGGRQYQVNTGNRLISGNVGGGQSFRGYSPIRDASSLFTTIPSLNSASGTGTVSGLPSDRLGSFRRDSFSLDDARRLQNMSMLSPAPYYSPSSTVTNTGAIVSRLNMPGTSVPMSPSIIPQAGAQNQTMNPLDLTGSNQLSGLQANTWSQYVRTDTGQAVSGPVNQRLLASPLFSGVRAMPGELGAAERGRGGAAASEGLANPRATGLVDVRGVNREPVDRRINPPGQAIGLEGAHLSGSPLDRLLGRNGPGEQPTGAGLTGATGAQTAGGGSADQLGPRSGGTLARPIGERGEAGQADTRSLARPLGPTPNATESPAGMGASPGSLAGTPTAQGMPPTPQALPNTLGGQAAANAPSNTVGTDIAAGTVRSFVGTEQSRLNQELASAEADLKAGRYYDAARRYAMAQAIDMSNPMPLFGRSMALLAAGDYLTSANDLFRAIQSSDRQLGLRIDMTSFIPDMTALDRRRAFLEQRLENLEDFRLRFLLGFAEYSSGLTEIGLKDMQKATTAMPDHMEAVKRYVETLSVRHAGGEKIQIATQPASR